MEQETKHTLFDILSDLDCVHTELEDVINLLVLQDEELADDIKPLRKGESWGGEYFKCRWPLHLSTLNVIRVRLHDILKDLETGVKKGFDALGVES